jgi:dGTPase
MRRRHEALRRVFGVMVEDVLLVAGTRLGPADLHSAQDIRDLRLTIIRFSDRLFRELKVIRQFLFTRMYRAPSVVEMRTQVTAMVQDLFPLFMARPEFLPTEWRMDVEGARSETELARIVADYVSGMTDRFAIQEHKRLVLGD